MSMRGGAGRVFAASIMFVSLAGFASAEDDAGVHAFFSNALGQTPAAVTPHSEPIVHPDGGRRAATYRASASRYAGASYRSLTVHRQPPKIVAAAVPSATTPTKVSMYVDPTMRVGDAVMTADGIRIFAGSQSWPYAKSDFVTLAQARDLSRDTVKILASLNEAPHS